MTAEISPLVAQVLLPVITIVVTVLIIAFLILIHELGHLVAAKSVGVKVEKFAIGFGPKMFQFKRGETEYSFRWIMLGGFVQMYGDNDPSSTTYNKDLADHPQSYLSKKWWQKLWITIAGPLVNFVFAALIFTIYLWLGAQVVPLSKIDDYQFIGADVQKHALLLSESFSLPDENGDIPHGLLMELNGNKIESREELENFLTNNYNKQVNLLIYRDNSLVEESRVLNGDGVASNLDLDFITPAKEPAQNSGRVLITEVSAGGALSKGEIRVASPLGNGNSDLTPLDLITKIASNLSEDGINDESLPSRLFLTAINNKQIYSVDSFLTELKAATGNEAEITLLDSEGNYYSISTVLPGSNENGILGVRFSFQQDAFMDNLVVLRYMNGFFSGIEHSINVTGYNAYALVQLLQEAIQGRPDALAENISSVVMVGGQVGEIVNISVMDDPGFALQLLNLIGLFSAVLAFMNMLPIPVLDGGNAVFIILEALRGKPLPDKVMNVLFLVFFGLMVSLSVLVVVLDIVKLTR